MIWRSGLVVLTALGLVVPALLWLAATLVVRFTRDQGIGATIYVAAFLIVGFAVGR